MPRKVTIVLEWQHIGVCQQPIMSVPDILLIDEVLLSDSGFRAMLSPTGHVVMKWVHLLTLGMIQIQFYLYVIYLPFKG